MTELQRWIHYLPGLGGSSCLLEATVSKQINSNPILLAVTEMGRRGWGSSRAEQWPLLASSQAAEDEWQWSESCRTVFRGLSCREIDGFSFKTHLPQDMVCLLRLRKDVPINLKHDFKNITWKIWSTFEHLISKTWQWGKYNLWITRIVNLPSAILSQGKNQ